MADKKISALTSATTPLAGTEVLPIVQSGATVKVAVSDLTAGRAISATQLTLSTGNLIVANGQGVDFSATPGTGTSELLADYEEGTWTPSVGGTATYNAANTGSYVKIGNLVSCQFRLHITAIGTGSTSVISGLPFTSSASFNEQAGSIGFFETLSSSITFLTFYLPSNTTSLTLNGLILAATSTTVPATVIGNNTVIFGSISYRV